MAEANIEDGHRVLEPSAGTGRLIRAIGAVAPRAAITAIEINTGLWDQLVREFQPDQWNVRPLLCLDFLEYDPERADLPVDRIVMNPPFAKQADIRHVNHALRFLKPGGRLVAIMSAGVTFRQGQVATRFREMVEERGGFIEPLPPGTFKESGTGVNTVLVVIDAPEKQAAVTEPTREGLQYVVPGCEKVRTRSAKPQMELF